MEKIIEKEEIYLNENNKIIWKDFSIGYLKKGHNYLNPDIDIIADDTLDEEYKVKLENFLKDWFLRHINEVLGDLINLTKSKIDNQYLRALVFQLYENNGVIKRDEVEHILKLITTENRKKLWSMGIKIGRYHIYLPKMLKPKAVELRISLWKLFNNQNILSVPKSGLNFLTNEKRDKRFLLLCGFEKFNKYFVRIDILEKLFIMIIEKTKNRKFQINSQMMNLLGCSKSDFYNLMEYMNYKKDKKSKDTYAFKGDNKKKLKNNKINLKDNIFEKLLSLNIK